MNKQTSKHVLSCLSLTKYLHVVEHCGRAGRADAVVGTADVRPRVPLAHGVDQQVAEQEAGVVMAMEVLSVLCPCHVRSRDATGHTLQHQSLAFGDHNGPGRRRVNDTSRLRCGAWRKKEVQTPACTFSSLDDHTRRNSYCHFYASTRLSVFLYRVYGDSRRIRRRSAEVEVLTSWVTGL